ncbi:MAG: ABC transporter substrate-binding protein [Acidimicrobiales bacterium]
MKKKLLLLLAVFALFAAACGSDAAETDATEAGDETTDGDSSDGDAMDDDDAMAELTELNVAYFAEWPTPNQLGQADGTFGDAVGLPINWKPFNSGGEMSEAMLAGDVDIAYSQGLTPFANTTNNGADLKVVGIAVAYAEADNCVAQGSLGITQENAAEVLKGATVITPIGNVTHYKMLSMMEHLGVDLDGLNVVPAEGGAATAAAFETGEVAVGCAFGGSVVQMLDSGGELIMTGAEHESDIGIFTYDIVSIPTAFGEAHPDVVSDFLAATEEFNQMWAADPGQYNDTIAAAAGMEDVGNFLDGDVWFSFPTIEEQLSDEWLGGYVADNMKEQLATFVRLGEIPAALEDFSSFVDTSYLEAAQG